MSWLDEIKKPVPVLIVDDNAADLALFEAATDGFHRELVKCESAEEALAILKERRDFQMIILDERLGGMRGMELFKRIIEMYGETRPNVFFLTGHAGHLVEEVNRVGYATVLGKPLGPRNYLREMMIAMKVPTKQLATP